MNDRARFFFLRTHEWYFASRSGAFQTAVFFGRASMGGLESALPCLPVSTPNL
jgi:hypothetical protein